MSTHLDVLISMYLHALRTKRKKAFFIGAEISDFLIGMESAWGVDCMLAEVVIAHWSWIIHGVPRRLAAPLLPVFLLARILRSSSLRWESFPL
jgi:hypothetical protein